MLTRLRVKNFKNLVDVDVSFGPFTCIAGANGVGKSNLFDAITFLSALADRPLMDAAKSVRDERYRATDVRSLFLKLGTEHADEMSFEAEMLVPESGQDDLGQTAKASITFLVYRLTLRYRREPGVASGERIEVVEEDLRHINVGDAHKHLGFPHSANWRKSVVKGRRVGPFLSTEGRGAERRIKLHQDGRSGKPREYLASQLPRTVLSSTNALESPTALLARREMQSWRLLQLEPSSLRQPDSFHAPVHVGVDGSHLASTLQHLARREAGNGDAGAEGSVFARVANALSALVDDVREVRVDEDRQRELFTLQVVDRDGNLHAARALSDGTLRFLALAILDMDPEARGLLCFEEPENGIHPERIPAMLRLVEGLCVGVDEAVGPDNPLRQVIVNTHSPAVVGLVKDDDLLVAVAREVAVNKKRCQAVRFSWLRKTWRATMFPNVRTVSRGLLAAYLNPLAVHDEPGEPGKRGSDGKRPGPRRVKDREDLQPLLPFMAEE
ncbi:MAG: AAA family ATPase [Thermoguttaceae bacterium]|jgi:predicted ATPase|nr:AAA family ATPase [Thermoguttaceae bacterium]